jgi:hypothetical protein
MTAQNPFLWMNAPIYEPRPLPIRIQRRRSRARYAFAVLAVLAVVVGALWGMNP